MATTYLSPGVYVEEVQAGSRPIQGVGTAVAAFVGLAERGPFNEPRLVTNWSQFTQTFGEFIEGSYLAHAVYGYFNNGGGNAYVVRVGQQNGGPAARAELPSGADAALAAYRIVELEPAEAGGEVAVEVSYPADAPEDTFTLTVSRGSDVTETHESVTTKKGKRNVATIVNKESKLIQIEELASGEALGPRPAAGVFALAVPEAASVEHISPDDYVGDTADRTGFGGLEAIDEVTMLCVPDALAAYQAGMIDLEGLQTVQMAMISHCESLGDRMAILDAPPGLNPQQVHEWRVDKAGYDSPFATLYWPWIKSFDPVAGKNIPVPPSGHLAGIWARTDGTRGVHKAPANEVVRGAISLEIQITKGEHDLLNPDGINCIRAFPGQGIRVWGARTLASDASWRYVNVRRLFNYVEESIEEGTQWVVFEPNDQALWARIRRTISSFLLGVWRTGALFGATPAEAFYVKCDAETNPPDVVEAGQVICEIGIAPVKPAEFVIFRIAQYTGGATVTE